MRHRKDYERNPNLRWSFWLAWDGNWLCGVPHLRPGDAAVSFLLAHKYGHLVQHQLSIESKFHKTIKAEVSLYDQQGRPSISSSPLQKSS